MPTSGPEEMGAAAACSSAGSAAALHEYPSTAQPHPEGSRRGEGALIGLPKYRPPDAHVTLARSLRIDSPLPARRHARVRGEE
jgi:hypothetical protein